MKRRKITVDKSLLKYVVKLLIVSVVLLMVGIAVLMAADKWHDCLESGITCILKQDNYFSGDLWFSAAATLIGAFISSAPGAICGILAWKQTMRLHELEDRYHAPMMELKSAELKFIRAESLQEVREHGRLSTRQYSNIKRTEELGYDYCIDLKIDFYIKNGITLKDLEIHSITFSLDGNAYKAVPFPEMKKRELLQNEIWDLKRHDNGMQTDYALSCNLCRFHQESNQEKENFWEEFEEFASYDERYNFAYMHMGVDVGINLRYEYNENKGINNLLKMMFDVSDTQTVCWVHTNITTNGYFTYDI